MSVPLGTEGSRVHHPCVVCDAQGIDILPGVYIVLRNNWIIIRDRREMKERDIDAFKSRMEG